MNYLKSKEQVVADKMGSINESVFKMGDVYKVKTTIDIPKSLINAFVSKSKKEHNVDPRENWSDVDLAEMFANYIIANFVTIESLPVNAILGEPAKAAGEVQTDVQPAETAITPAMTEPVQTPLQTTDVPAAQNEPTSTIEQ